jgi:hypothetical protein
MSRNFSPMNPFFIFLLNHPVKKGDRLNFFSHCVHGIPGVFSFLVNPFDTG